MVTAIHHVQISFAPSDKEAMRAFYVGLLGMKPMHDPFGNSGFWLAVGDQQVHFRPEPDTDRRATRAHAAFLVNALSPLRIALMAGGFAIEEQPKIEGFDHFHTFDPSGNRIELMQALHDPRTP